MNGIVVPMDYHGRRVTIFGLGSFGGGVGAARFFAARGARVTVTDLKTSKELAGSVAQIADLPGIILHLGGHSETDILDSELVVVSPGVPRPNPFVTLAVERGIPVTSEMNLFWRHNRGRIAGITGSNGKSTTTALLHSILSSNPQRRCWLGGNIGRSLLPDVDKIQPEDWVILELSSFQLEDLASEPDLTPAAKLAIVTNFSPNHLDRHESLDAYRLAKQRLLRTQRGDGVAVLNRDDPDVSEWATFAKRLYFGWNDRGEPGVFATGTGTSVRDHRAHFRMDSVISEFPLGEWLRIPGRHNFENAMAAACGALGVGATLAEVERGVRSFSGLPHRLEFVAEKSGRQFYNDSKATTPAATCLALSAFPKPIVLLAGGYDKQIDLSPIVEQILNSNVRAVAFLGQTGRALNLLLEQKDPARRIQREVASGFSEACDWALSASQPGDVVLLSPGCASYDWFTSYEARGAAFQEWVHTRVE